MINVLKINCGLLPKVGVSNFLPPGVAYTTGLSHNPFTWLTIEDGDNYYAKKQCYLIICKIIAPVERMIFSTVPL